MGALMGQLDASIVTVALPSIQRDLHASVGAVAWVGLGYLVALVATVAAVGRLSDLIGRKLVYLQGFVSSPWAPRAARSHPSSTGSSRSASSRASARRCSRRTASPSSLSPSPASALAARSASQGAAQALGLAAGPSLGGLLLALGGWRLLFFVNVPTGLLAFGLGWFLLPRSTHLQRTAFPSTCAGSASSRRRRRDAPRPHLARQPRLVRPVALVALVAVAIVLAVGFSLHERRASSPLLRRQVLGDRSVRGGCSARRLLTVLFGVLVATPFLLERGLRLGVARRERRSRRCRSPWSWPRRSRDASPSDGSASGGDRRLVARWPGSWCSGGGTARCVAGGRLAPRRRARAFTPATNASVMGGVRPNVRPARARCSTWAGGSAPRSVSP